MADHFPAVSLANKSEKSCDCCITFDDPIPNMALHAITDSLGIVSGGEELVDHVAIDVTASIDVPSKNSGPQDGNNDGDLKKAAFFAICDCATSITAIVSNPPSSGHPAYLVAVVTVSTVSALAVLAALWVSGDTHKRRTAKRMILCASIATFILGLVLDGYACKVKK